jgi:SAM-dependent methyltransferase
MKITMQSGNPRHALSILNALYEYDDFMASVASVVDLGCGTGADLEWWASATTRDDNPEHLNIQCVGVDQLERLLVARKYSNIIYQSCNFENSINQIKNGFDVLWCYDAFQYVTNPISTLTHWRNIASESAMLVISVPQTIDTHGRQLNYHLKSGCYYHHTLISLMQMLSLTGWDCASGFFQHRLNDPWITAIVYKSNQAPRDPGTTNWYELAESGLLPDSAVKSIQAHGYLKQQDLVLPWLDKSMTWLGKP